MSLTAPPVRLRAAAVVASITLLATSCGSDSEETADEAAGGDSAGQSESAVSLNEPGILAAECSDGSLVASVFSDENGEEIASHTFSGSGLTGEEVPGFPAGRTTDAERVTLPICAENAGFRPAHAGQFLIPEYDVLLVTVKEEVGGTSTETFGVLDSEGNVSVLTEEQDIGDFDEPARFDTGRYDATQNRIIYLEHLDQEINWSGTESVSGLFHQIDLESGETTEAFECAASCRSLWIDQDSGLLSWVTFPPDRVLGLLTSPDGSIVVERDSNTYWSADDPAEATVVNSQLDDALPDDGALDEGMLDVWDAYFTGPLIEGQIVAFVSDTEIVLSDNELSVIEVAESEIGPLHEDAGAPRAEIPVAYSLVPDGPRTNSAPVVSPDLSEVMFISTADSGEASWYRVPTDGSADPTEVAPVPDGLEESALISWT